MSDKTKIEWANHTGGPHFGCSPVSPGCANCYAWELAEARLEHLFRRAYKKAGFEDWETRPVWGDKATRVLSKGFWVDAVRINKMHAARGTRGRWFPSMIDWLDTMPGGIIDLEGNKLTPSAVIASFLKLIHDTPSLDWLLLTKRPENWHDCIHHAARELTNHPHDLKVYDWLQWWKRGTPPANVVIGASTEGQAHWAERVPHLLKIPAYTRFISAEPLLGALEFSSLAGRSDAVSQLGKPALDGLNWIIVGGESGHKARPCSVEWIRSIVKQCKAAGVPVFVKQLGAKPVCGCSVAVGSLSANCCEHFPFAIRDPKGGKIEEWPEDLRIREYPTLLRPAQS